MLLAVNQQPILLLLPASTWLRSACMFSFFTRAAAAPDKNLQA
jgi:hypothetical protein